MDHVLTTSTITGPATKHAHYMGLSGSALRTAVVMTAGLCFLAFGYGQGDIGGLLMITSFREQFPAINAFGNPTYDMAVRAGVVLATWNMGCLVGAFLTFFLCNLLGRKGCIMLGLAVELIGKIVQVTSFSLGQLVVGRVVAGIGNGFIASTIPAWQAECLKTHRRGTLLMVSFGTCITLGLAISYWVTYALSFTTPSSVSWRFPTAFSIIFILPALLFIVFLPESPRFLILSAREQEALNVLSAFSELPPDHEDVRREALLVKNTVLKLASGSAFSDIFRMGETRYFHRVLLAVVLQMMQQWTGVNLFVQYLGTMFGNQLHYPVTLSLLLAACCSTEFFLASLIAVVGIDRYWGRRALTMFGAAGMSICMVVLSIMNYINTQTAFYVMTVFLFLYCTAFAIGWQGMSWLWGIELIPLSIRGPANALATAANWLSNIAVVLVTPAMFTNITWKTYITFAVTNALFVPLIYLFYPETGSRSLEEVDLLFSQAGDAGKPWTSVVAVAKKEPNWFDKDGEYTESKSGGYESGSTVVGSESEKEGRMGGRERERKGGSVGSEESV